MSLFYTQVRSIRYDGEYPDSIPSFVLRDSATGLLWCIDSGWTSGARKSCSITPLFSWTGERNYNNKLLGQDKDREITQ